MPIYYLMLLILLTFGACQSTKKTTAPKDVLSTELLQLSQEEIHKMANYVLEQGIKQLQTSIPIEEKQIATLEQHPKFQQLLEQNHQEFATWLAQQKSLTEEAKKEAIACLQQPAPSCPRNPILQHISGDVFIELVHDVGNYSVQMVLDRDWIPANEADYDCSTVQKGNFYYYMPGGSSEVVYMTRTDSSQKESLEGEMTNRKVTWTGDCSYSLTAWEPQDNFQLDFEIVHVASDHYLFLCKAPYKGEETTLLLGRVNKSLE